MLEQHTITYCDFSIKASSFITFNKIQSIFKAHPGVFFLCNSFSLRKKNKNNYILHSHWFLLVNQYNRLAFAVYSFILNMFLDNLMCGP